MRLTSFPGFVWLGFGMFFSCDTSVKVKDEATVHQTSEFPVNDVTIDELDLSGIPFKKLSEYGFFKGVLHKLDPQERLVFYEPASSLFTDYAFKSRYIWMPAGSLAYLGDREGDMDFPENTILIKNFYYPADFRKPAGERRILETRLLVNSAKGWEAYPYVWNESQTEAEYKVVGAEIPVSWLDEDGKENKVNYVVPNKNQCKSCHNNQERLEPIGVKAKHLNYEAVFGGKAINQLQYWQERGVLELSGSPESYGSLVNYEDGTQELASRARAYLDINCAHCHREEGPGSTSGLFLTYEEDIPLRLGIFKTPVAAGFGAGSHTFDIYPGDADASILLYRMETNEVGAAMPEIGRVSIHKEGVALIRDWINSLER